MSLPCGTPPLSASKQKLLGGDPPFEPPPFQQASNDNQEGRPPLFQQASNKPQNPLPTSLSAESEVWRGHKSVLFYFSLFFLFRISSLWAHIWDRAPPICRTFLGIFGLCCTSVLTKRLRFNTKAPRGSLSLLSAVAHPIWGKRYT